jgi:hypothetical protein
MSEDVTLEDMRAAVWGAVDDNKINLEIVMALYKQAFDALPPVVGTFDRLQIADYIRKQDADDAYEAALILPFGFIDSLGCDDKHSALRSAYADLARAVAVFFLRKQAFWLAWCRKIEAENMHDRLMTETNAEIAAVQVAT